MSIRYISMCAAILIGWGASLQAQTEVRRYNATADTDYGVVYRLPRTQLEVIATVRERIYTPGVYAIWAEKYLGVSMPSAADRRHEIVDVQIRAYGVADTEKQYLIAFDKRTIAPFVSLGQNNLIYNINGREDAQTEAKPQLPKAMLPDRVLPALPREYSLATSEAKQAELAAAYLYEVREAAMSIITGEVESMPKDGESMRLILDKLRTEEKRTLRLFAGDTTERYTQHSWEITPETENMNDRILCRFSEAEGVIDAAAQEGYPILFSLHITERTPELSDKDRKKQEKLEGITYNVPGAGVVTIGYLGNTLAKQSVPITQVGGVQVLSKKMFNVKDAGVTAIYFDPNTGALERIVNE
ncbi:MAG: DUF4831 family protein [Porphyromonadaceae bacterium]|nr:DUF4831 family protein [Porphyromonadaceae bacterium]